MNKASSKGLVLLAIASLLVACSSKTSQPEVKSHWEMLGPGGGGATYIPTFSYFDVNSYMMKCDMTGNYITYDGGHSYEMKNFKGEVNCFAYDPTDSMVIYVGGARLYRSTDAGANWQQLLPADSELVSERYLGDHAEIETTMKQGGLFNGAAPSISIIKIDPADSKNLYLASDSLFIYSNDRGESWSRLKLNSRLMQVYTNNTRLRDTVLLFTRNGIYQFHKKTKQLTNRETPGIFQTASSFSAGTSKKGDSVFLYAITNDRIKENDFVFAHSQLWTSADLGSSWQPATSPVITNEGRGERPSLVKIVCAENDASKAYVVCNNLVETDKSGGTKVWYGALKTDDAGNNWQWVWKGGGGSGRYGVHDAADAPNLNDAWVKEAFGKEFIQLIDVGVYQHDGNTAVVTDWYRAMKTMDGGLTWNEVYSQRVPNAGYRSRGLDVTNSYGVHFDPFDSQHVAISYTDIGYHHSFDGGTTWHRSVTGVPVDWVNTCYWLAFDPQAKGRVWSAWSGNHDIPRGKMTRNPQWKNERFASGGICVSDDGGRSWRPVSSDMGSAAIATSIVIDTSSPVGNRTLYASIYNQGVYRSTDDGKTWQLKNNGIGENTCAFEITQSGNGDLYLVVSPTPLHPNGQRSTEYLPGAVYKSVDRAENWIKLHVADGMIFPNGIEVDPKNPDRIFLAAWSNIRLSDLVGAPIARAVDNPVLNTPGGIHLSEDGGKTWRAIFDTTRFIYDVTVDPRHPGRIYANSFNHEAYRSDDHGKTWKRLAGYDFHWGHRVMIDPNSPDRVYLTTFGGSVWRGIPAVE